MITQQPAQQINKNPASVGVQLSDLYQRNIINNRETNGPGRGALSVVNNTFLTWELRNHVVGLYLNVSAEWWETTLDNYLQSAPVPHHEAEVWQNFLFPRHYWDRRWSGSVAEFSWTIYNGESWGQGPGHCLNPPSSRIVLHNSADRALSHVWLCLGVLPGEIYNRSGAHMVIWCLVWQGLGYKYNLAEQNLNNGVLPVQLFLI